MPKTRLGWLLMGLMLVGMGFLTYANKGWHFTRFGPTHHTAGYVFLIGGMIICLFAILKKDFPKGTKAIYVMCASCLTPSDEKDLKAGKCPKCNGSVEKLDGFYDRHPDLKESR